MCKIIDESDKVLIFSNKITAVKSTTDKMQRFLASFKSKKDTEITGTKIIAKVNELFMPPDNNINKKYQIIQRAPVCLNDEVLFTKYEKTVSMVLRTRKLIEEIIKIFISLIHEVKNCGKK